MGTRLSLVLVLSLAIAGEVPAVQPSSSGATPKAQAESYLSRHVTSRLAQAEAMVLVMPHWEHRPGVRSDLFVVNNFREPIDAELTIFDTTGRVIGVEILTLEPASHREVPLSAIVATGPGSPSVGSSRIRYSGDVDMVQAWTVVHGPGGSVDLPAKNVSASTETRLTSFWDVRRFHAPGGLDVEYAFVNGGLSPITYRVLARGAGIDRTSGTVVLYPGERHDWTPRHDRLAASHGWIEIEYDGSPGALAVTGLLRGRSFLGALPVTGPETQQLDGRWESIRLPFDAEVGDGFGEAAISLLNPTDARQRVDVALVSAKSGERRAGELIEIGPRTVHSVRVDRLIAPLDPSGADSLRVVVAGSEGLLAQGFSWSPLPGVVDEIPLFPRSKAHPTGSYPVPDPSRRSVRTTLVNVGAEETRIVAQLTWDGGTYALGPVTIPGGGSRILDFRRLAAAAEPDILGRTLSPSFAGGHLHWTVQGGSTAVLARTEVMGDLGDRFGFNCFGCCLEQSYGDLLPGEASFPAGLSTPFEGVEFIESCTGTMGPYSPYAATWNYAAPFNWSGSIVSASAPAVQSLWFTAKGHRTAVATCEEREFVIMDTGSARSIKVSILDVSLPTNTIRVKLEPTAASGTLKVYLSNPSQRVLTAGSSYAGGTHTFDFGNLSTYSAGQEFSKVVAEWTVGGKTVQASSNYRFRALGSFNHTRYNTPTQSYCTGPSASFCYFTGTCAAAQSCTGYTGSTASSQWLAEVHENGSGFHSTLDFVSREWSCPLPQGCGGYRLRDVPLPCPYCQGMSLNPGVSVAVHPSRTDLPCGTNLFVDGVGVVTVADHGTLPSSSQLDHYVGASGCNRTAGTIGFRPTFRLF